VAAIPKEKPSRTDESRAEFARYKADVKARGKPFYPYAMFHDTIMSMVVVTVIVALAAIWKWSSWGPGHDPTHKGLLGPVVDPPADPGTTSFVPRPDWYFYFLFYLFSGAGCTACHTYLGSGGSQLGAPDLSAIGSRNLGVDFQIRHLECPSCVNAGSPMPPFKSLGVSRLRQLALFLEASKGGK
jgi:mono/diheme cytochrome c family protein